MGGCAGKHAAFSHSVLSSNSGQNEYRPFPSQVKRDGSIGPGTPRPLPLPVTNAFPLPPPPSPRPPPPLIESNGPSTQHSNQGSGFGSHGLKVYTLIQLSQATDGFNDAHLLGQGGFGKVYKGFLPPLESTAKELTTDGLVPVAIKRLASYRVRGQAEWLKEILVLSKIFHPNLVLLLGYCTEKSERLLVFEFLPFGSLDYHLFADPRKFPSLAWTYRLKIALESAMGLAHLHKRCVIHRDFKAQNILLDTDFSVKLTDFGMARETEADKSHVSTLVMGTIGYLDPNYGSTGRLTAKSDVYSYGVFLLELLTGRRAMQNLTDGKQLPLVLWMQPMLLEEVPNIQNFVDPYLQPSFPEEVGLLLAYMARRCVSRNPKQRPSMEEIVEDLSAFKYMILEEG